MFNASQTLRSIFSKFLNGRAHSFKWHCTFLVLSSWGKLESPISSPEHARRSPYFFCEIYHSGVELCAFLAALYAATTVHKIVFFYFLMKILLLISKNSCLKNKYCLWTWFLTICSEFDLHTWKWTVHIVHLTVHSVHYTELSVHYTLHTAIHPATLGQDHYVVPCYVRYSVEGRASA